MALFVTPHLLDLNPGPPACAPCDRGSVPWFDRWAIAEPRDGLSTTSTAVLAGLGAVAAWDLVHRAEGGWGEAITLGTSTVLAVGVTELLKSVANRKRPVLYTTGAVEAAGVEDARRSWPSGHTAAAFAVATSYGLSLAARRGAGWRQWAALGVATAVGGLRVAAARHFPSDVAAGALVGVVSAVGVHAIRF